MNDRLLNLHPAAKVTDLLARGQWTSATIDQVFRDQVRARGDALALAAARVAQGAGGAD